LTIRAVASLEDLGSKNGTYLDAQRIDAPAPLRHGDQIRIGAIICSFRAVLPMTSTETLDGV